jgi:hypothetical protein
MRRDKNVVGGHGATGLLAKLTPRGTSRRRHRGGSDMSRFRERGAAFADRLVLMGPGSSPASVLREQLGTEAAKVRVERDFRGSQALEEAGMQQWAQAVFSGHLAAQAAFTASRVGLQSPRPGRRPGD